MNLIYIYDLNKAIWMSNNGAKIYRIGKGNKGDVLITFERTTEIIQLEDIWHSNTNLM